MRMRWAILLLSLALPAAAATYYVSPSGSGDYSGSDRNNCMTQAEAEDNDASAGDIFLYQPGTYAAMAPLSLGTSGNPITYKADPGTCGGMSAGWYENAISKVTSSTHPVTTRIQFQSLGGDNPTSQYLVVEGFAFVCNDDYGLSGGAIDFSAGSVADVTVRNCMVWGYVPASDPWFYDNEPTQHIVSMYNADYGRYRNILVENVYGQYASKGLLCSGQVHDNVIIKNCHFRDAYRWLVWFTATPSSGDETDFVLDGLHLEQTTRKCASQISLTDAVSQQGSPTNQQFYYVGSYPSGGDKYVTIEHAAQSTMRDITAFEDMGSSTYRVTVSTAFPWAIEVDDVCKFHDDTHTVGIGVHRPLTIKNCRIHNVGNTGTIYSYGTSTTDILIENNLLYAPHNQSNYTLDFSGYPVGEDITIRNNTIVSRRHSNYPANARYRYGLALSVSARAGTNTRDTWSVTNNLVVGNFYVPGGRIYNNTMWCNWNNCIANDVNDCTVYCDYSNPWDGTIFESIATTPYFVCGTGFDDTLINGGATNCNAMFKLVSGSPAINDGSSTAGDYTPTDFEGQARDATPDQGFDELDVESSTRYLLIRSGS